MFTVISVPSEEGWGVHSHQCTLRGRIGCPQSSVYPQRKDGMFAVISVPSEEGYITLIYMHVHHAYQVWQHCAYVHVCVSIHIRCGNIALMYVHVLHPHQVWEAHCTYVCVHPHQMWKHCTYVCACTPSTSGVSIAHTCVHNAQVAHPSSSNPLFAKVKSVDGTLTC